MRRSSWLLIFACLFGCVPLLAHAAAVLTPIIPVNQCNCTTLGSAPNWGCVLGTIQIGINDIVAFATIIITVYIAWAGFAFILSPTSAEGRQKARQRIVNAVIGLVIVLCAWLLVDSLMKVVYNSSASGTGVAQLGPWNSILSDSGDQCIKPITNAPPLPGLTAASNAGGGVATTNTGTNTSGVPSAPPNISGAGGACSPTTIQSDVQAEGGSISAHDAAFLGCIAGGESTCGTNPKAFVPQNNGSSALGPFQVLMQGHGQLYNNSECEKAAGVSGPLNCQTAFSGGNPIQGNTLNLCEKAAADLGCSAIVADQLYDTSGASNWKLTNANCGT